MRAADTDREAVAERLRDAVAEGRLSLEELEERLDAAYTAKTLGELEPLIADLPEAAPAPGRRDQPLMLRAGTGTVQQTGYWVVPSEITVSTGMGNAKLDFTAAECAHRMVTVEVAVGMGSVNVVVPRGWEVRTDEVAVGMGKVVNRATDRPEPGATVLRFTGQIDMGNVKVRYPSRLEAARARRAGR
ncbi:DUF1707 domain-containing protein [Streptomyces sp. MST-110588]|uniref:DUF1707 SHOCT-like domain-containing protein n=1 Tax=Streptomyces sp. MST-110588 TaxID=2833628 RepID=UPI001F5D83FD|nr:DUF1707 domain-containing protein [Streptomyces sp. MST-110588]UNO41147.1 DUF1707 and DUF2154 domain-containing protein [Streptomyces sp. MST-110588]